MLNHGILERHGYLLVVGILLVVSIGGIVEMAPLFYLESTIEKVGGVRPYTPLELAGRDIYVREACYTCHSQQIRPLRDEVERYGHYSLAAESMYDHPFQWGSKRTGPDLARVGGKYSDAWQVQHLVEPRSLVPESVMPPYKHLAGRPLDLDALGGHLAANRMVGVPYTKEQIASAREDALAQLDPLGENFDAFRSRYPTAVVRNYGGGDPRNPTEMDALVAYLQVLGTMVDFSTYKAEDNRR